MEEAVETYEVGAKLAEEAKSGVLRCNEQQFTAGFNAVLDEIHRTYWKWVLNLL